MCFLIKRRDQKLEVETAQQLLKSDSEDGTFKAEFEVIEAIRQLETSGNNSVISGVSTN